MLPVGFAVASFGFVELFCKEGHLAGRDLDSSSVTCVATSVNQVSADLVSICRCQFHLGGLIPCVP